MLIITLQHHISKQLNISDSPHEELHCRQQDEREREKEKKKKEKWFQEATIRESPHTHTPTSVH
jgi:hypothetical protein